MPGKSKIGSPATLRSRFEAKVVKADGDACWVWIGCILSSGYGQIDKMLAHRVAWFLEHGRWPIPCALHKCDNPSCVRVSHLSEGTHADNTHDMIAKGRNVHGEAVNTAKLTSEEVLEIRRIYQTGGVSQTDLALRFGVCQAHVSDIVRGKAWKARPGRSGRIIHPEMSPGDVKKLVSAADREFEGAAAELEKLTR